MSLLYRLVAAPVVLIGLLVVPAAAQRTMSRIGMQPQAQVEYALAGNDYVLGAVALLRDDYSNTFFAGGQARVGYEHFWNKRWSIGGTISTWVNPLGGVGEVNSENTTVRPEVFIRHWSTLGQVNFRQRAGLQYRIPLSHATARPLVALRLDADRVFPLGNGGLALRPRLAFEPIAYLRFQREEYEAKEPFLDFSELRGEVGVRLSSQFDCTPWFA